VTVGLADLDRRPRLRTPDVRQPGLEVVGEVADRHVGRALREAVDVGDLAAEHPRGGLEQAAVRRRGYESQAREPQVRRVGDRDEVSHRGVDAGECGDAPAHDQPCRLLDVPAVDELDQCAVGEAGHEREHRAAAVEHRAG
jgi:hypothetical protein